MFGVVYMDFNISFDMAKYPTQLKPVVSMESANWIQNWLSDKKHRGAGGWVFL